MENKNCDILIIGAGPAGLTAAIYAARAGNKTVVLEKLGAGGQVVLTPDIENYPGFKSINGAEFALKLAEQAEHCGAEIIYDEIETIDFEKKIVSCTAVELTCKAIIICTGAGARKVNADGEDCFAGEGVHYCALCDGAFYKDKDIVIIGGGNSAVGEAIYMSQIAKTVTVINSTEAFNAQKVLINKLSEVSNIKAVHHNSIAEKIIGEKKVEGIEIRNKTTGMAETIPCNGIFVAIGRMPSTELFKDKLKLNANGYIFADSKMQTSVAGVYAAGDVIEKNVRQIITACADGAVAATHATEYIRSLS